MAFPDQPSEDDVDALIRHQYPESKFESIKALLGPINASGKLVGWPAAKIRFAALVMSGGKESRIRRYIDLGNTDASDLQMFVEAALGPSWIKDCLWETRRNRESRESSQ